MKEHSQSIHFRLSVIFVFVLIYFPSVLISGDTSDSAYEIQLRNLNDLESDFERLIGEVKDVLSYINDSDANFDRESPEISDEHLYSQNEVISQSKSNFDDINPSIESNDFPFEFVESLNYDQFEDWPEHTCCLDEASIVREQSCHPRSVSTKCRDHNFAYCMANFGDRPFFDSSMYTIGFMLFEDFFSSNKLTLFIDLNASYYDYSGRGLSAGVGFRYNFPCTEKIFGFNAYFDYFDTNNFSLRQACIGFEWFDCFFEFRSNIFFPVGKEISHAEHFLYDDYIGDYIVEADLWVKSLKGIDLEIGRTFNFCNGLYFYPFISGYYFSANSCKNIGVSGGVRLSWLPYFSVEGRGFYDKCNYAKGECSVTINLPFEIFSGQCCRSHCIDKRYQSVYRKNYIPFEKRCVYETNY